MAGALGGDHDHVQIFTRHDLVVVHVEAVGESQGCALLDVGLDVFLVHLRDVLVRQQDHDEVCSLDRLIDFLDLQAGSLGLVPRRATLAHGDGDLDAGIVQVLGVGVALRAIADDGDLLALDQGEVGVLVVINFHVFPFRYQGQSMRAADMINVGRPTAKRGRVQSLSTRSPRPMPQTPDRTVSRISPASMAPMKASSLDWLPVSSMT
ncbi:hypothetical protein SDC9_168905 [bioreactor metagenome]|uniref:Uncharacterized protein n=1 Tax=bioreactor metagenome TaxID=1076179 RepID=A0A645G4E7_9ZZZZ